MASLRSASSLARTACRRGFERSSRRSSTLLADADPAIRAWTIQLATEQGPPAAPILAKFAELARSDPSPMVRLYLASAMQRLPLEQRWDTLTGLVGHREDASDHNLPLMYWYAAEPLVGCGLRRGPLPWRPARRSPRFQEFMARRIAALGTPESLGSLGRRAGPCRRIGPASHGLDRDRRGAAGRRRVAMPATWPDVFKVLGSDPDATVRSRAVALGVNFGDLAAQESLRRVLADSKAELAQPRSSAMAALLEGEGPSTGRCSARASCVHPQLGGPAVRGLSTYDDPATPEILIKAYPVARAGRAPRRP